MRLIDADELKAVYVSKIEGFEKMRVAIEVIIQNIDDMPTVDAVPVVRCRDCKHHHYEKHFDKRIPYCDRINYGYGWQDNDYCSRGERKGGDGDD